MPETASVPLACAGIDKLCPYALLERRGKNYPHSTLHIPQKHSPSKNIAMRLLVSQEMHTFAGAMDGAAPREYIARQGLSREEPLL